MCIYNFLFSIKLPENKSIIAVLVTNGYFSYRHSI